jgi:hypothetical protein
MLNFNKLLGWNNKLLKAPLVKAPISSELLKDNELKLLFRALVSHSLRFVKKILFKFD